MLGKPIGNFIWREGFLIPLLIFFSFTLTAQTPEADTPCEATNRWEGGSTWLNDGGSNDAPNAGGPNV